MGNIDMMNFVKQHIESLETIYKHLAEQNRKTSELELKISNLEALQLGIVASISVASPEIYATIKDSSGKYLIQLEEQGLGDSDFAKSLRAISGVSEKKKPHLWLVPQQSKSPTGE